MQSNSPEGQWSYHMKLHCMVSGDHTSPFDLKQGLFTGSNYGRYCTEDQRTASLRSWKQYAHP